MNDGHINVGIVAFRNGWFVGPPFRYNKITDEETRFSVQWCEDAVFCKTPEEVGAEVQRILSVAFKRS